MASFAELNNDNLVLRVLSVHNNELLDDGNESEEKGIAFLKKIYGSDTIWKQTSYNTRHNVYYEVNSVTPHSDQSKVFRRTHATEGGSYNPARDAFADPQPYPSWILDQNTGNWVPPVAYPVGESGKTWSEDEGDWVQGT